MIAVGDAAPAILAKAAAAAGFPSPTGVAPPGEGEVLFWRVGGETAPRAVKVGQPRRQHQRHKRKYATGELGPDKSFYFRGPQAALNLRASNLTAFVDLAQGVDEATWLHHLERGDYSRWFRESLSDDEMADEAHGLEADADPSTSRRAMKELIKRRYAIGEPGQPPEADVAAKTS